MGKVKSSNKMKLFVSVVIAIVAFCYVNGSHPDPRSRIVRIKAEGAMCSGEQIVAPSGQSYILSAGHCDVLAKDGVFTIETEDHKTLKRRLVAEDPNSDLLLIEGIPGMGGIPIADYAKPGDSVHTLTHGSNLDTYETKGVLVQRATINAPLSEIKTQEDAAKCASQAKTMVQDTVFGKFCVMSVDEMVSTAVIVPGSSGGAALNSDNELVGVASCSRGDGFSSFVLLSDIQAFIKSY